jgi:hypothetical protein
MNKVVLGLLLGGILGIFDGLTAWFTPEARAEIVGIVIGSCIKGMIAGLAAGWFARKVHSVAAGLAFGLAVGALLAYGIVAMQGNKYFFEIMLPGSIVGAIVGWATQRYGRSTKTGGAAAAALLLFVAVQAHAASPGPESPATAGLARLKSLAGAWSARMMSPNGAPATIEYRVVGGGTVVMETLFGGTPHEMITMYSIDGDDLIATHYCSAGNQPTMRLDRAKSTPARLVFDFVGVRGEHAHDADHIHSGWIEFQDAGHAEESWSSAGSDGNVAGQPKHFYLARQK